MPKRAVYPKFGDVHMAVFNSRPYGKRLGREAVIDKYGQRGWKKVLARMKTGIMEIFHHPAIPETRLFLETVGQHAERFHSKLDKRGTV